MSARRPGIRLSLTLAACALLAACAIAPQKPLPKYAAVIAAAKPPPVAVVPLAPLPVVPPARIAPGNEPWASLTAGFAMRDCNDSPLVRAKLSMYTRSPARFEQMLRQSLPLMMYVHAQLRAAGVPGEFVMLPMLESSYNASEPSRRGDPAGMWQLMPRTARSHGITINHHYDGRLDPIASTRVAIDMLSAYGRQFGDWRLADMAYNAGPYAVIGALRKHPDLGNTAIPDVPLSAITRKHLAKLMALACILREPARFHVTLPQASPAEQLMAVKVPAGLPLRDAARMAEIPVAKLRALNPGYLGSRIPAQSPDTLLLPTAAAGALAAALAVDSSETVAQVDRPESAAGPSDSLRLPAEPGPPPGSSMATQSTTRHRVREGETLWSIARDYDVSIDDLKRWNHLHGDYIRPGEDLRVRG